MRLELRAPAEWTRQVREAGERGSTGGEHRSNGGELWIIPGYPLVPDLTLEVDPIRPRLDVSSDQILRRGLPAGATFSNGQTRVITTETGWPMGLLEAQVLDAHGAPLELRLLCAYQFLGFVGAVLVRATDRARLAAHADDIIAVLRTAQPRFRDARPAEISELWELGA